MDRSSTQLTLFECGPAVDRVQEEAARTRMHEVIGRLTATVTPPWREEMGFILEDGAFRRAMRLVPDEEAQALWVEYDAQMARLYDAWVEANPLPAD